ncbi:MAG: YkvA family protein, partial [Proteobacteria bacterium]|nr:YkvA family protein [Pseudomonadota bacterium]
MLRDEEFALTAEFRTAVVTALAYFADPHDLIPDEVPGLGYLDDAIMVEIVRLELQAEIDAYDEFRASLGERRAVRTADPDAYTKFLDEKRAKLFEQLRERRGNFYDHG